MRLQSEAEDSRWRIDCEEVYQKLKDLYSDFYSSGTNHFDELVAKNLRKMIFEEFCNDRSLFYSQKTVNKIVQRYYNTKKFKDSDKDRNKSLKWQLEMLKLIFKSSLILLAEKDPEYVKLHELQLVQDVPEMLQIHPILATELSEDTDGKELNYLKTFLNYIRIAMPLIPVSSNKHLLLKIIERLEGSNQHYVTGGGMKAATRRRMELLAAEGNAPAVKRTQRKKRLPEDATDQNDWSGIVNEMDEYNMITNNDIYGQPPFKMTRSDNDVDQPRPYSYRNECQIDLIPQFQMPFQSMPAKSALPSHEKISENKNLWNLFEAVDSVDCIQSDTDRDRELMPPPISIKPPILRRDNSLYAADLST